MPQTVVAKKRSLGTRSLLWAVTVAMVGAVGTLAYATILNRAPAPIPVSLETAQRGNIESTINESGTVELRGQKTIKSPTEGAVETVLVKPGQRVQAGQTLLTLRYPERQTALANQQLLIRQQELTLKRNQQRVTEAREQLAVEERKLQQLIDLVNQGAIDRQRFQDQEDRLRRAQVTLRDAESTVGTSEIELERSRLEQKRILQQLQNSVITAPIDAVVLDVKVKDGEGVELRTELLTLGDPNQEYIQLRLSTLNAKQVQPNQLARVSMIGPNPKVYTGRVQQIYPQAVFPEQAKQGGNNRQSDQATVPAVVKLDRPTRALIPGAQVNVEIVLEQVRDAITLTSEAVQRTGEPFVWIKDSEGKAQKRSVTTGLEGLLKVEIKSGLDLNDRVIIPPADPPLSPGIPVKLKD